MSGCRVSLYAAPRPWSMVSRRWTSYLILCRRLLDTTPLSMLELNVAVICRAYIDCGFCPFVTQHAAIVLSRYCFFLRHLLAQFSVSLLDGSFSREALTGKACELYTLCFQFFDFGSLRLLHRHSITKSHLS